MRSYQYGFATGIADVESLLDIASKDVFHKMQNLQHCLYNILRTTTHCNHTLRDGHDFTLPH